MGLTVPSALTTKFVNHHRRNRPGNDGRAVRGQDRPEPVPADDPFGVSRDDLPEREREAREGPKVVWGGEISRRWTPNGNPVSFVCASITDRYV